MSNDDLEDIKTAVIKKLTEVGLEPGEHNFVGRVACFYFGSVEEPRFVEVCIAEVNLLEKGEIILTTDKDKDFRFDPDKGKWYYHSIEMIALELYPRN